MPANSTGFNEGNNPEMGGSANRSADMPGYGRDGGGGSSPSPQRHGSWPSVRDAIGRIWDPTLGAHVSPRTRDRMNTRFGGGNLRIDPRGEFNTFPDDVGGRWNTYPGPRIPDRGGTPASARTTLSAQARMTPSQKRSLGLFHNAKGKLIPIKAVATAAVKNLLSGKKLTRNQNLVIGRTLKSMTPNERRAFAVQLAVAKTGQAATHVRESFGKAIGKAYKVSRQVAKNARSSTQIQKIAAARPNKTYRTAKGKTRTATQVLKTAARYAKSGKALRSTHRQIFKTLNVKQLRRLGVPKAGRVAKQLRNNARKTQRGRRR